MSANQTQQLSRHGRPLRPNQGQSLRSTPPLQNTRRGRRNQVELFLTLCARPDAEATARGTVASHLVTQNGIISAEPRVGLQQGGVSTEQRAEAGQGGGGFREEGVLPPSAHAAWDVIITSPAKASNQAANQPLLSAITEEEPYHGERNKKTQQWLPLTPKRNTSVMKSRRAGLQAPAATRNQCLRSQRVETGKLWC